MTFFELVSEINKEYDNKIVNLSILFYLSKKVKNQNDLISFRNHLIDFDNNEYQTLLKDYYVNKKPLGHIIHSTIFNNVEFKLLPMVHCPRNETELLAIEVQNIIKQHNDKFKTLIDICAGSGCIGISIKYNLPQIDLSLVEIDDNSVNCIMDNLANNKIQATIYHEDFFNFIKTNKIKYDVIVFNPPYVSLKELDNNMCKYENKISFNNSENEMLFYEELIKHLEAIVDMNKFLIGIEFGYDQKEKILKILKQKNLDKHTTFYQDLNRNNRFAIILKY